MLKVTGGKKGSSNDPMLAALEKLRLAEKEVEELKKTNGWTPKSLESYTAAEKTAWFDTMYSSALQHFNERKAGKFSEDDDDARYTFENVIELLGKDVWDTLNKF
jgi:hypothetical protein